MSAFVANGGTATINQPGARCGSLFVADSSGISTLNQSGGSLRSSWSVYLGNASGTAGTYNLSSGSLTTGTGLYVGYSGTGTLTQSGGAVTTGYGYIYLGYNSGSSGTYNLSGSGLLSLAALGGTSAVYVGYSGTGNFVQSGGTNVLGGAALRLGYNAGSSGTYTLTGGQLSSDWEAIGGSSGSGLYQQSGGANCTSNFRIGTQGTARLSGGTLQITSSLTNQGVFDGCGGTGSLIGRNSIVDLSGGTVQNVGSLAVSMDSASLLILPSGFDPQTGFGSYRSAGLTHNAGSTLEVRAGKGFRGSGTINDPVDCQGTINAGTTSIDLNNGITLSAAGAVNLGAGTLTINGTNSSMTGGSLAAIRQYVGRGGTGTFTVSGGANILAGALFGSTGTLFVGYNAGDNGTYLLGGPETSPLLVTDQTDVGYAGAGVFTQASGTHATGTLRLADSSGSSATYNLGGGVLRVGALSKGSGTANFNFSRGTLQATAGFSTSLPMTLDTSDGEAAIDTGGYSVTLSGMLSGPGSLTKTGNGVLVLNAANTYGGPTTVGAGTLSVKGSLSSNDLVVGGGTFSYAPTANGATGNTETFAAVSIDVGASVINASSGNTLALGTIAKKTGGFVNFNSSTTGMITTLRENTNGILGPWATCGSGTSMKYAAASGGSAPYAIAPYTGATVVTSGVTDLSDTTGTINYMLSGGGGTLAAAVSANTLQFSGAANTITASSSSPLSLNGIMNIGSGTATVTGGSLVIGSTKELVCVGPGNVTIEAVVRDNASGPSVLTMAGSGALVLNGANAHSGGTIMTAGTLNLNTVAALGDGPLTISGGTINNTSGAAMSLGRNNPQNWNGNFTFLGSNVLDLGTGATTLGTNTTVTVSASTLTAGGIISGPYRLTKAGSGMLVLGGDNTHSGGTTLSAGTLALGHPAALGNGPLTISGGTIDNTSGTAMALSDTNAQNWNGNFSFAGSASLDMGSGAVILGFSPVVTVTANELIVGGPIMGNYSLTKAGAGTLTLCGASTYTRGVTLSSGRLNINHDMALGSGIFTISGPSTIDNTSGAAVALWNSLQRWDADFAFAGTQDLDFRIASVTLGGNRTVTVNAKTLTVGGAIGGSYSLTKSGAGMLILSGANTYTGTTTISDGKLAVNGSLATAAVSVNSSASLGGTGSIAGGVMVNSGGHVAPGDSIGTLALNGGLSLAEGAKLDFDLGTPDTSDKIAMSSSTLTLTGQQFTDFIFMPHSGFGPGDYVLIDANTIQGTLGASGSGTISGIIGGLPATISTIGNDVVLHVVPEPGTLTLLGVSVLGLLSFVWRRRTCKA